MYGSLAPSSISGSNLARFSTLLLIPAFEGTVYPISFREQVMSIVTELSEHPAHSIPFQHLQ